MSARCRSPIAAQKEEEEAAKAYEDFVEAFTADEPRRERGGGGFVRGGVVQPGSNPSAGARFGRASGGALRAILQILRLPTGSRLLSRPICPCSSPAPGNGGPRSPAAARSTPDAGHPLRPAAAPAPYKKGGKYVPSFLPPSLGAGSGSGGRDGGRDGGGDGGPAAERPEEV
jgi:hypothetical protein